MKTNVGTVDRILRVLAGGAIIVAGVVNGSWWGAIGAIPLLTATLGWCPLYCPFKISTAGGAAKDT
jgi:hypothetical protein